MQITEKQKYQLKKFIKELERHRGRHTELVSVYIPQNYDIIKIINHLEQEKGTAMNIKSAATRKNVIDSLEKMIQHLRLYKKTPENGLAVFSGNVAEREGFQDFKVWSIDYAQMLLKDDLERLLKVSSFKSIDFYGTYRFNPYDVKSSDRLIAIAHK